MDYEDMVSIWDACCNMTSMADAVLSLTPWVVEMWLCADISANQTYKRRGHKK